MSTAANQTPESQDPLARLKQLSEQFNQKVDEFVDVATKLQQRQSKVIDCGVRKYADIFNQSVKPRTQS